MKNLFLFFVLSVFVVSVNARNVRDITNSANTTIPSIEKKCNIGYHEVDGKCIKLYCNDLQKISVDSSKENQELYYNKSKKCYEPKISGCDLGFALKENKCEKVLCSTQPSSAHRKTSEEKIIDGCYKTVAKTCDDVYEVSGEICVKKLCLIQPSVSNSSKSIKDFLYEKEKCFVTELATECEPGYELKNKNTDMAVCEKEKVLCSRQPSLKNSIKTIDNFIYETGKCIIEKLPTKCKTGYSIYKSKSPYTECRRQSKGSRRN